MAWICIAGAASIPSSAQEGSHDFDRAYDAVQSGEALPLATVLERLQQQLQGEVLGVEFTEQGDTLVYVVEVMSADGRHWEARVNAATAETLTIEQK